MDIEYFKNLCQEEQDNLDRRVRKWEALEQLQTKLGHMYKMTKHLFRGNFCPNCKTKLIRERMFSKSEYIYYINSCSNCNYQYASRNTRNLE